MWSLVKNWINPSASVLSDWSSNQNHSPLRSHELRYFLDSIFVRKQAKKQLSALERWSRRTGQCRVKDQHLFPVLVLRFFVLFPVKSLDVGASVKKKKKRDLSDSKHHQRRFELLTEKFYIRSRLGQNRVPACLHFSRRSAPRWFQEELFWIDVGKIAKSFFYKHAFYNTSIHDKSWMFTLYVNKKQILLLRCWFVFGVCWSSATWE